MPATNITFANAALTRSGLDVISSFADDTARAKVMNANYETLVLGELSRHRWNWATKFQALSQLVDSPPDPWLYAYQLPADVLQLRTVRQGGDAIEYALMATKVFALVDNADADVVADYIWRPDESRWPPSFASAITYRLEAVLLRAFGERHSEAAARDKAADDAFALARRLDSQSQSPRDPFTYPILAARRA